MVSAACKPVLLYACALPVKTKTEAIWCCICTAVNQRLQLAVPCIMLLVGPPFPPSELTATPLNETSIKLTWSVPPGVLDEELISYLVEVRNESGGLIVLSETDGTEYTFSMDNPDPCDLYSFTVTPSCGTVEGGSSAIVKEAFLAGK